MTASETTAPATTAPPATAGLDGPVRHQIMMLIVQFLLGMGANLIGYPQQTHGGARLVTTVLTGAHVLIAVGLLVGAVQVVRRARAADTGVHRRARVAAALIGLTFVAGVLTMSFRSDWWSYLMAVGFIAALASYGSLVPRTGRG